MAPLPQLPDLMSIEHSALGITLARLEEHWRTTSPSVDAGVEPAGIDAVTLGWWRSAYRLYVDEAERRSAGLTLDGRRRIRLKRWRGSIGQPTRRRRRRTPAA